MTKIERNTNSSVATATVSNGVLTVKGVAAGTTTITTDLKADKITFQSFGKVKMNVVKYDLAERGSK